MNDTDPEDTAYFAPTKHDKPLPRTRPGHWASQPQADHPRARPTFTLHSNPMPLQLRTTSHPVGRTFDNAMCWGVAVLVAIAVGAFLYFR